MTPVAGPRSIQASTAGQAVTKQTLYLVMAVALVWPAVFGRSQSVQAVFGNRVMRYAGDISYGVFLYHLLVLDGVMNLLDNPLWTGKVVQVLPLTVAGSVALAAVSFRYLERPIIVWAHGGGRAAPRRR
jgi:peptidoglycan/LPS O-acetylase OafA/YrhL